MHNPQKLAFFKYEYSRVRARRSMVTSKGTDGKGRLSWMALITPHLRGLPHSINPRNQVKEEFLGKKMVPLRNEAKRKKKGTRWRPNTKVDLSIRIFQKKTFFLKKMNIFREKYVFLMLFVAEIDVIFLYSYIFKETQAFRKKKVAHLSILTMAHSQFLFQD